MSAGSGIPCLLCPHNELPFVHSFSFLPSNAFSTIHPYPHNNRATASLTPGAANNREQRKMVTFKVPSESPPSTPGSSANSPSPRQGPNTFRVPSATPSEEGDDEASPVTPRLATGGPHTFRVPSASPPEDGEHEHEDDDDDDDDDDDGEDHPHWPPSSSPDRQPQRPHFVPPQQPTTREHDPASPPNRGKRSASPSPSPEKRGALRRRRRRYDFRPMTREERIERARAPVPGSLFYGVELGPGTGTGEGEGEGEEDEDEPVDGTPPAPEPERGDPSPSASSSPDVSEKEEEEEVPPPLVRHQPHRTRGKLGRSQPTHHPTNLTLLSERPGKLPSHTARSPTSPGFDWSDGATWWHPANSSGTREIAREITSASWTKDIRAADVEATAELLDHENLVRILDWDGFTAPAQTEGREEVLFQFCKGGTLNKLLLSRRPEQPVLKPRRPATYLPTREVVAGLPEDLVWHVMISLLRATSWLHHRRRPVVHCSIDPANVFFHCTPTR